jgi:aryl-alcohol dehydrogenase-like predicted oxidoreductase
VESWQSYGETEWRYPMSEERDRKTLPPTEPIPRRVLGKTGEQVTIYGLGGLFTTSRHDRHDEAVEIVNRAIDLGINYIDTSALYGHGASELNIGTVMKERRDEVFLGNTAKVTMRCRAAAMPASVALAA